MAQRQCLALQMLQLECGIWTLLAGESLPTNQHNIHPISSILKFIINIYTARPTAMTKSYLKIWPLGWVWQYKYRQGYCTILYTYAIVCSSYGELIYTLKHNRSPILSMCWCGDMSVAIGYKNGSVHIINIISAEILQTFQGDSGGITTMAYVEHQDRYVHICMYCSA